MPKQNKGDTFWGRFSNILIFLVIIVGLVFLVLMFRRTIEQKQAYADWAESVNEMGNTSSNSPKKHSAQESSESSSDEEMTDTAEAEETPVSDSEASPSENAEPVSPEAVTGFYQKLAAGLDVQILVLGDSIASGYGAADSSASWTVLLQKQLQDTYHSQVSMTNLSAYGNTTYNSYINVMQLQTDIEYDLAIICHGENDSPTGFALYYEALLQSVRSKYPQCAILSVLEGAMPYNNQSNDQTIRTLCQAYNIPIADVMTTFSQNTNLSDDGIYPNNLGHQNYCNIIANIIDNAVSQNVPYSFSEVAAVNEKVSTFNRFVYYPAASFTRTNDTSYTLYMTDAGAMSLDTSYNYSAGSMVAQVYIDSSDYYPIAPDHYESSEHLIVPVADTFNAVSAVRIIFNSSEEADAFQGLIVHSI